jgi:hypothetical protein
MAMPTELPGAAVESIHAHAHAAEPSERPATPARPRRPAGATESPRAAPRHNPDEEAMLLMLRVVERVEVARSFAKIAAGIFTVSVARTAHQLRGVVDREGGLKTRYDRIRTIARAAAQAAVHVATHRTQEGGDEVDDSAQAEHEPNE